MLFADLLDELSGKGLSAVLGLILGGIIAWVVGYWCRRHLRHKVLRGDARDTVVIHHHLIETESATGAPLGSAPRPCACEPWGKKNWGALFPTPTSPTFSSIGP